jgi:hypothetical protein
MGEGRQVARGMLLRLPVRKEAIVAKGYSLGSGLLMVLGLALLASALR